jgi:hypothetical protein
VEKGGKGGRKGFVKGVGKKRAAPQVSTLL